MMRTANAVVLALGMYWIGLLMAPGDGATSEIIVAGVVGTAGLLAAFVATEMFNRSRRRQKQAQ